MKTTLTTMILSALLLVVCVDHSVLLSLPETQFTHQSKLLSRFKLPEKEGMSLECKLSVTKSNDIKLHQEAI
jgi:hypothetical protein